MCLQVLFLGPALPSTFELISKKLVVSPVLRTLTLKRVLPYVKDFAADVCKTWPDIQGFLACHYSGRVGASTRDFRRAFGFAFVEGGLGEGGEGRKTAGGAGGGLLRSLGLEWLARAGQGKNGGGSGAAVDVDPLSQVPEQDLATLNFVNDFVVRYGLADASKDESEE